MHAAFAVVRRPQHTAFAVEILELYIKILGCVYIYLMYNQRKFVLEFIAFECAILSLIR